ncbi:MAG: caspase family protein [Proteobacteria bacterium]|nr:caspase family protein [Pseudomonadota bacterium]
MKCRFPVKLSCTIFFLIFTIFFALPSYAITKKALLIGINNYKYLPYYSNKLQKEITNLKGAVNDVNIMKERLINQFGFSEKDIMVLTDSQATRPAILKAFNNWLVNGTKEGDTVFFHFSGHGAQIPDENGDEDDGLDETLCTYEMPPKGTLDQLKAGMIIDDELGVLFRKLEGRSVTAFLDSCHSGTATRSMRGEAVSKLESTPAYRPRFIPVEIVGGAQKTRGRDISLQKIPTQTDVPPGQVFIFSSMENQLSQEMPMPDGTWNGALTLGIVDGLKTKGNISYNALHKYVWDFIKNRHKLDQSPQIEPTQGPVLAKMVFTPTIEPIPVTVPVVVKPPVIAKPPVSKPKPPSKPQQMAQMQPVAPPKVEVPPPAPQKVEAPAPIPLVEVPAPIPLVEVPPLKLPIVVASPPAPPPAPQKVEVPPLKQPVAVASPLAPPPAPQKVEAPPAKPPVIVTPPPPAPPVSPPLLVYSAPEAPPEVKDEKVLVRIDHIKGVPPHVLKKIEQALAKINHIKLTKEDFFDRILRGEVNKGLFQTRLVNRIGDAVQITPTKNVDELIQAIARQIESDYMVKQLARIHNPNPSFNVKVWITDEGRNDFRVGEKAVFNFRSDEDCYLLMINTDSKGNVHLMFPNRFYRDNFIRAGEERKIPDERMGKKFELEFGEPVGEETVKVIATKEPIDLDKLGIGKFEELLKQGVYAQIPEKTRTILVKEVKESLSSGKFAWSDDTLVIRSHSKR